MKKIKIGDCFLPNAQSNECMVLEHLDPIGYACLAKNGERSNQFYLSKIVPIPTLHLPIGNSPKYGGPWFYMILIGAKREEYRELSAFYESRFYCALENPARVHDVEPTIRRDLKILHLTNGYGHDKPQLWAHIESISIGRGNPEWGAPVDRDVFIIKIGEVFHTKNLKP